MLGRPVTVYSYAPLGHLPPGIENRDAAELLPTDKAVRNRATGSPSLHSNLFRYALMRRTDHVWVDLDVVALRPLAFQSPHVFAFQNPTVMNSAVLRLPRDSAALRRLLRLTPHSRSLPPTIVGWKERTKLWLRTWGRGLPIEDWPWGSAGPRAVTEALRRSGEIRHALPPEAFYPVRYEQRLRLLRRGLGPDSFGPGTLAVHLWAQGLREPLAQRFGGRPPATSFVGWALERARKDGFVAAEHGAAGRKERHGAGPEARGS